MTPQPVIQTAPHNTVNSAIYLKGLFRIMFQIIHKGLVMPVIVILFHRSNFFLQNYCDINRHSMRLAETDTCNMLIINN